MLFRRSKRTRLPIENGGVAPFFSKTPDKICVTGARAFRSALHHRKSPKMAEFPCILRYFPRKSRKKSENIFSNLIDYTPQMWYNITN